MGDWCYSFKRPELGQPFKAVSGLFEGFKVEQDVKDSQILTDMIWYVTVLLPDISLFKGSYLVGAVCSAKWLGVHTELDLMLRFCSATFCWRWHWRFCRRTWASDRCNAGILLQQWFVDRRNLAQRRWAYGTIQSHNPHGFLPFFLCYLMELRGFPHYRSSGFGLICLNTSRVLWRCRTELQIVFHVHLRKACKDDSLIDQNIGFHMFYHPV